MNKAEQFPDFSNERSAEQDVTDIMIAMSEHQQLRGENSDMASLFWDSFRQGMIFGRGIPAEIFADLCETAAKERYLMCQQLNKTLSET